jgi:hypothetical protein
LNKLSKYLKKITRQKASNIKVVVLCVLAATTFWVLNALNKDNYNTIVNQPIEFYYDREEYRAVEELPSNIRIEIYGNGWDLLRKYFKFNVIPFPIELSDPSAQEYLLTSSFQRALAEQTSPTQLADILEDTLKIKINKIIEEKIKVVMDTSVNPLARKFRFASEIRVEPDSVTVKGPSSIIEKLQGRIIIDWEEENITENYSKSLALALPEDSQRFLELENKEVQVGFEVVEFLEGSRILDVRLLNFPSTVKLMNGDTTVIMEYLLDEREVDSLKTMELEAVLNYRNRNREDSTIMVRLNRVPVFLDSINFEPEQFKLIYE